MVQIVLDDQAYLNTIEVMVKTVELSSLIISFKNLAN